LFEPTKHFSCCPSVTSLCLARLQARMVQAQPRGISVDMHMFSDGVVISRGKSLCAAAVRGWSPHERSPKLRDRVGNLDCVLHLVSNDDGMFRFMSRCIEGIIETAFAGLRYECWCPVRDQHGNTVDWMQFDGGSAHAVAQCLSSTLEEKNIFDIIFDGQQLYQLFALCCPIFISHAWNDGTFLLREAAEAFHRDTGACERVVRLSAIEPTSRVQLR